MSECGCFSLSPYEEDLEISIIMCYGTLKFTCLIKYGPVCIDTIFNILYNSQHSDDNNSSNSNCLDVCQLILFAYSPDPNYVALLY